MRHFSVLVLVLLLILIGDVWGRVNASPEERRPLQTDPVPAQDRLLAQAQCGACHALSAGANGMATRSMAPDLEDLGARMNVTGLRAFLEDPSGLRPRTRMPNLMAGLSSEERFRALESLPYFLLGAEAQEEQAKRAIELEISSVEKGRQLFHNLGCVACHGAFEEPASLEHALVSFEDWTAPPEVGSASHAFAAPDVWQDGPTLDRLGELYQLEDLTDFLFHPLDTRPYGLMPDMGLGRGDANALAQYLLFESGARSGSLSKGQSSGLDFAYFEGDFLEEGPPAFDRIQPVRVGRVRDLALLPQHRSDRFGFRYSGIVELPQSGRWTFSTISDDGSWLWIDGKPVVANGGAHPPQESQGSLELEAGPHSIEVRYFELTGGEALDVRWQGPRTDAETIPAGALSSQSLRLLPSDRSRVPSSPSEEDLSALRAEGQAWFRSLGCAACHSMPGVESASKAPAFAALGPGIESGRGCLAVQPPSGLPRYPAALIGSQGPLRQAAAAAAQSALHLNQEQLIKSTLLTMGCVACHERAGVGAPRPERRRHFAIEAGVDLGDEGRVPPTLDHVGWKLKSPWLKQVLAQGTKVRPYMLTHMPRFGIENVGHLVELLPAVDRPVEEAQAPPFSKAAVLAAQELMGTGGLGCVQCHDFAGYEGLGVPAVDLATTPERLRWTWFRALLADPGAMNMNTRMPEFWTRDGRSPVGDICDGDPEAQVAAIWGGLSLGENMPLPEGLVIPDASFELTPKNEALCVGVFWKGASARTVLVGFPERLHVAFDVENSRLATAWRGRFFNARGTWEGRAGALEQPPSDDVFSFPRGAPFAFLSRADSPWPSIMGREAGWRARGREFDSLRRPTFLYSNAERGDLLVCESPEPVLTEDGVWLRRTFQLSASKPDASLRLRAAGAVSIEDLGEGKFQTSNGQRLWIVGAEGVLRSTDEGMELLVPIPWGVEQTATFQVESTWTKPQESPR